MNALATLTADDDLEAADRDLAAIGLGLERMALEASLYAYTKAVWPLLEPDKTFEDNWHIEILCLELEAIYHRKGRYKTNDVLRVLINVPPGTMKSLLISVIFPTWVWARNAKKRFMMAAYGAQLSTRDNLRARQIIESPWYQARWPVKLLEDQNTKTQYNTDQRGWRFSTSVNGQGTGQHPDFIIIDDPHSAQQAESEAERGEALGWFDRTVSTRLGRNPTIIVVMQRLHTNDLSGHLLARGGCFHIRWPMRFEKCSCVGTAPHMNPDESLRCLLHKTDPTWVADQLDPRTIDGELLWPSMFPESKVRQMELDLAEYGAAGQLQQRPAPLGGGLFKREWFRFADAKPAQRRIVRGWDTAGTENGGDYTVGVRMSEEFEWRLIPASGMVKARREYVSTGRFYVEDVQRDQLGPDGVDKLMKVTAELDGVEVPVREEREGGASGKGTIASRTKLLVGYDYKEVNLGANKVVRAKPYRSQVEGGNVYLVRGPWNEAYIQELTTFPNGKHDDQVDGSSCAFNALLLEPPPRRMSGATWGAK